MTSATRRLLFVSYWIAPRNAIGTIRCSHILHNLPKFGWEVDTLTARFNGESSGRIDPSCMQTGYYDVKGTIKRLAGIGARSTSDMLNAGDARFGANRRFLGRVVRFAADFVTYPDDYVGWLPYAARAVRKIVRERHYDALLTSSPPVTTNLIAALARPGIPWIADLRDLWAEDDSGEATLMKRLFDDRLERAALSRASALVASSELSARRFRKRYPEKPCYAVRTGYDPQEWSAIPFGTEPVCTLVYAGNLYRGRRDPSLLFFALQEIFESGLAQRGDVRIDFYSQPEPWLIQTIEQFGLGDAVRVLGSVDRNEVLAAERKADRLLVFSWDGPTAEGIVPGKLFEYFGARRPILAIGGPQESEVGRLLEATGAGVRCITAQEVKRELLRALVEHGHCPRTIAENAVCAYTAERCALAFAGVLNDAASHVRPSGNYA
jgi:glycosyltransferase involved in cell wall biosynthesis